MTAVTESRPHGTRARYVHGPGPGRGPGCRCEACTAANRRAAGQRDRQIIYGRWQPYVDAGPAREHLQALSAAGVGWKRAAELAGVSTGAVSKLLYGGPADRPPTRRIRPETAAAILAVRPAAGQLAPSALTGSTGTRRRLQALVATGWSQARLARELGLTGANFGAMMRRDQVTAGTARAVSELYDRLWNQLPPEQDQRTRIAASRARRYAAARGWAPPLAWDDDVIDDPRGRPAESWKRAARRASADLAEDAGELIGLQGYSRQNAAARLGVSIGALDQAFRRMRSSEAAPPQGRYEAEAS
jgi:hypothetical protein